MVFGLLCSMAVLSLMKDCVGYAQRLGDPSRGVPEEELWGPRSLPLFGGGEAMSNHARNGVHTLSLLRFLYSSSCS